MLFWYQLVGTGITTTWMAHLGAVSPAARWPAVTCMNMYVDQLVTQPVKVHGGFVRVPETPGLGIEFNESALKYKTQSSEKPPVDAVFAIQRDNGQKIWFHGEYKDHGYWYQNWSGNLPPFERGVKLVRWDKDGSREWNDLAARVKVAPVWD
jgi:galactonate dehydratase